LQIVCAKTIKQSSHVAVLGAGPSIRSNLDRIKEWIKNNNAIVFVGNYRFPIKTDYTMFVSPKAFKKNINKVRGKIIITANIHHSLYTSKKINNRMMKLVTLYKRKYHYPPALEKINIKSDGQIGNNVCSSGFGAMLCSVFCNPSNILIAGFDGYARKGKGLQMTYFHQGVGSRGKSPRIIDDDRKQRYYFINLLIPAITDRGIVVNAFKNDKLRGVSKNILRSKGIRFI